MHLQLVALILWLVMVIGWGMNVYALATTATVVWTGLMILKVIGIVVVPLGALMGLFF